MPVYNLFEYSNNYAKASGSLWQYLKDDSNDNIKDSNMLIFKAKVTGKYPAPGNKKDVEIAVLLKYLRNFWRTFEMSLINCKINLILTWSVNCVITDSPGAGKFEISDRKLYIPVVIQNNSKRYKGTRTIKIRV